MSEMIAQAKCPFWPWSKGAHLWGEPLPYAVTEGGEDYVMCGDWWNRARIPKLLDWQAAAMHQLVKLCGGDRYQRLRAVAACHADRMKRLGDMAGKPLNARELFEKWVPSPEESVRIDDLVTAYAAARDRIRSWLLEARTGHAELEDELPADPETWTAIEMSAALMRLPKILRTLVATGELPDPGELMPEKATA